MSRREDRRLRVAPGLPVPVDAPYWENTYTPWERRLQLILRGQYYSAACVSMETLRRVLLHLGVAPEDSRIGALERIQVWIEQRRRGDVPVPPAPFELQSAYNKTLLSAHKFTLSTSAAIFKNNRTRADEISARLYDAVRCANQALAPQLRRPQQDGEHFNRILRYAKHFHVDVEDVLAFWLYYEDCAATGVVDDHPIVAAVEALMQINPRMAYEFARKRLPRPWEEPRADPAA